MGASGGFGSDPEKIVRKSRKALTSNFSQLLPHSLNLHTEFKTSLFYGRHFSRVVYFVLYIFCRRKFLVSFSLRYHRNSTCSDEHSLMITEHDYFVRRREGQNSHYRNDTYESVAKYMNISREYLEGTVQITLYKEKLISHA